MYVYIYRNKKRRKFNFLQTYSKVLIQDYKPLLIVNPKTIYRNSYTNPIKMLKYI